MYIGLHQGNISEKHMAYNRETSVKNSPLPKRVLVSYVRVIDPREALNVIFGQKLSRREPFCIPIHTFLSRANCPVA